MLVATLTSTPVPSIPNLSCIASMLACKVEPSPNSEIFSATALYCCVRASFASAPVILGNISSIAVKVCISSIADS